METPYAIREYPLQQGALEIAYIEEYFNDFPTRKSATEIVDRLTGPRVPDPHGRERRCRTIPATVVPGLVQGVARAPGNRGRSEARRIWWRASTTSSSSRAGRFSTTGSGATRLDWRGQGHFRALTEEQEVWAVAQGYDEIIVKTKNRYFGMRGTLDSLQFNVIKLEPAPDPLDSKVYLSKRLGPVRARCAQEPASRDQG